MRRTSASFTNLLWVAGAVAIWAWIWFQGPAGAADGAGSSITEVLAADKIEVDGPTLGSQVAPVQLLAFVDLRCGPAATFHREQLPKVVEEVVKTGKAKVTLVVLAENEKSEIARDLFFRLALTDDAWDFTDIVFRTERSPKNTRSMDGAYISQVLRQMPATFTLTPADLDGFYGDPAAEATQAADDALAGKLDLDGTPAFAVGSSSADPSSYERVEAGGRHVPDADQIIRAVEAQLTRQE